MSEIALHHNVAHTAGDVLSSLDTGMTAKSEPVYLTQYKYVTASGAIRTGLSYGRHMNASGSDSVTVVYSQKYPAISVIEGLQPSTQPLSLVSLAVAVLLLSLLVVLYNVYQSYKLYYLLTSGVTGEAALVKQTREKRAGLKPPIYNFTYTYDMPDGRVKTLQIETHDWLNLSPKVLHSDRWNGYCVLLAIIPGYPQITDFQVTSQERITQYLAIPAIAVVMSIITFIGMK